MRRIVRLAAGFALAFGLLYAADAASVSLRSNGSQPPTRAVQVHVMLAVPQKDNRVEFIPGGIETQTCLVSLFPHFGLTPCWYAERHTRKEVDY